MVRAADGNLRADGGDIHFKTAGKGPALLLLPGSDGDVSGSLRRRIPSSENHLA